MDYEVEFMPEAIDELENLDRVLSERILKKIKWFFGNFEKIVPEPLTGELKGLFKLRIGSYRAVYSIDYDKRLIVIHLIDHRKDIYR